MAVGLRAILAILATRLLLRRMAVEGAGPRAGRAIVPLRTYPVRNITVGLGVMDGAQVGLAAGARPPLSYLALRGHRATPVLGLVTRALLVIQVQRLMVFAAHLLRVQGPTEVQGVLRALGAVAAVAAPLRSVFLVVPAGIVATLAGVGGKWVMLAVVMAAQVEAVRGPVIVGHRRFQMILLRPQGQVVLLAVARVAPLEIPVLAPVPLALAVAVAVEEQITLVLAGAVAVAAVEASQQTQVSAGNQGLEFFLRIFQPTTAKPSRRGPHIR